MNKAYLLIGGNIGQRKQYLQQALVLLQQQCGKIVKQSGYYETAAWGKTDQPAFLNQALILHTPLQAEELIHSTLNIEVRMGRQRQEKYSSRIIDIDILLFNQHVVDTPLLQVPHTQLANRRFALVPLHEIAPRYQHPLLHKTIGQLLKECPDLLEVKKLED
jgi:2-amino-4-hydroxy-6-hydroxymethyldihydropteridine diphosphokinase